MAFKPKKPNTKVQAEIKPMADAVALSQKTPADTKALDNARKELEGSVKELGAAMTASYSVFGKALKVAPDTAKRGKPPAVPIPYPIFSGKESEVRAAIKSSEKARKKLEKAHGKFAKVVDKEIKGLSKIAKSSGDAMATQKGLIAAKLKGKDLFVRYSFDVKIEGENMVRFLDLIRPAKK
ncbi:MAG: PAAR-like domain-containing protein [Sulfitobacter sp.]